MQPGSPSPSTITKTVQDESGESISSGNVGGSNDMESTESSTKAIIGGHLQHRQQQQQQWDIDMAAEIGQSLMVEIKRMQGLLQEKNDSLSMLSLEKAEAYQKLDQLTSQLKQRSNDLELEQENIWTLELEKQELTQQVSQLQHQLQRILADQSKHVDREEDLRLELERLKQQHVAWQEDMKRSRQDKLDMVAMKKKLGALQNQSLGNKLGATSTVGFDPGDANIPLDSHLAPNQVLPTASSSCPLAMTRHIQQQRQQRQKHEELVNLNATLQSSLRSANTIIHQLQQSLDSEQNKRMEMETLWRETQETVEQENDRGNYLSLSTDSFDFPASPSSALSDLETQHNPPQISSPTVTLLDADTQHNEQRTIDKKHHDSPHTFLSLGEELSLVGSTLKNDTCPPTFSDGQLSALSKSWSLETLTAHTNLDEIMMLDLCPTNASSTTIANENSGCKPSPTIPERHESPQHSTLSNDSGEVKGQETYGFLWSTGSYIYQPSTIDPSASYQQGQHTKDTSTGNQGLLCNQRLANGSNNSRHSDDDGSKYIRALTRTMIGDWMWKYTRNRFSETRHRRFFWLHPYSRTLHWSTREPGLDGCQYKTKSGTPAILGRIAPTKITTLIGITHGIHR
ncbi:hypothetical protein [Absidia glauca]|uniref:Pleckstrin homology domain-containing protein n=1 Tax=Absidia glauca TaxID=4829 RepID=A0A163K3D5_ABSGL|nr:hypothetical protein [Absidia glauca]